MKFMIRSDIEGVTGVTTYEQAEKSPWGRAMLMNDLRAVIDGLLSTGDHEIVVYDEHTDGRNVTLEALPDTVSVICGKPPYRHDWGGIDSSFDAMLMVGFHARSGVPGALLPHTYSRKNLRLTLNEREMGEIGVEAAVAGDFGVPTWLVTGDSAGVAEARAILPGVRTVTVKEALGEFAAQCYAPALTSRLLREAARDLIENPPPVQPLTITGPVRLQIILAAGDYRNRLHQLHPEIFVADDVVTMHGDTVTEVWNAYCTLQAEAKRT